MLHEITYKDIQKQKSKFLKLIIEHEKNKKFRKIYSVFKIIECYKSAKMRESEIVKSIRFIIKANENVKDYYTAKVLKEFLKSCEVIQNGKYKSY